MIDLYKGEEPSFIKGYTIDENNNLVINCADPNLSYTTINSEHNINALNMRMEQQVLDFTPPKMRDIILLNIQSISYTLCILVVAIPTANEDTFNSMTLLCGVLLGLTSILVTMNLNQIKMKKNLLNEYKKCMYFIKNKQLFFKEENISINNLEEYTLKDLKRMIEEPIRGR